jgi:hypothetical protein
VAAKGFRDEGKLTGTLNLINQAAFPANKDAFVDHLF